MVPPTCLPSFMANCLAVASRLQIEYFQRVVGSKPEKSEFGKIGRVECILSLTVQGYQSFTISNSFGVQKFVFFFLGISGRPTAPARCRNLGF